VTRTENDWPPPARDQTRRMVLYPLLAMSLATSALQAQVVRGVVRESGTGTTVEGVLVTLERVAAAESVASDVVSALSNERGEFAVRARISGRYRLTAKRIGVKRSLTEPFELSLGETRQVSIEIEPVLYTLPEVAVATANFCIPQRDQVGRVAALWDEIRTALTATSISVRDSLYQGRILSFGRLLDGRGRILTETTHQFDGLLNKTFTSVDPESLSLHGYWREDDDSVRFDAPDIDVLLSASFLNDHCFALVNESPDEVGLRFQPVPGRSVADVRGMLWADARTSELRRLEFTYTRLPRVERAERLGGEVHFARLASGAWVVRRWSLRVPQFARHSLSGPGFTRRYDRADPTARRVDINKVVENRMIENGGVAYIDHLRIYEKPATVRGVARDSSGAPLTRAVVRLAGTSYETSVDASGRFELNGVPPGLYRVEALSDPALGIAVAEEDVTVHAGDEPSVTLRATSLDALLARLCGGRAVARGRSALRVVMIDEASRVPNAGLALRLWWTEYVRERGVNRVVQQQLDATTASDGSAVFCGLPVDVQLDLGLALGPDRARRLEMLRLPSRVPVARTIKHN
jgi:hypothetical protein